MKNDLIKRDKTIRSLEKMKDPSAKGDIARFYNTIVDNVIDKIKNLPSAQLEVTEEAVKEYCRKRCLCIVDSALLKKYASAQTDVSDTNVGDMVSRTAVIEIFSQLWDCMEEEIIEKEEWEDVCKTTANELPSAQPERKTGHWILVSEPDENGNATYRCSECHCAETHVPVVDVKYCWNCGTKMETDK